MQRRAAERRRHRVLRAMVMRVPIFSMRAIARQIFDATRKYAVTLIRLYTLASPTLSYISF